MTDRTGGPASANYAHRQRPENYEEEDEVGSDSEDVIMLKPRSGDQGQAQDDDEEERLRNQDLSLARILRLRAEGLEKVVTSMLHQPPPIHPINHDDIFTPPTSPKMNASGQRNSHPHTLPNGVRLRLALGTMVNDLFARRAPPPPFRYRHPASPSNASSSTPDPSRPSTSTLPPALHSIASISAYSPTQASYASNTVNSTPLSCLLII